MDLRTEVLADEQKKALDGLAPLLSAQAFYLAGGTATALHLGHRRSVDFDWFTPGDLDPDALQADLTAGGIRIDAPQTSRGTLLGEIASVPVSFFQYRYPMLHPPERSEDLGIEIASIEDLAAMKLAAVAQRATRKDFVDVHALQRILGLEPMLDAFRAKYARDTAHLLYALVYFDEADADTMPGMLQPVAWDDVKRDLREAVKSLTTPPG